MDAPTATVLVGNALDQLATLPSGSVDCICTSPPYWALREYNGGEEQIGLEESPFEYVEKLAAVFDEARRVLAPHGSLWLNLGDTYSAKTRGSDKGWDKSRLTNPGRVQKAQSASLRSNGERHRGKSAGLKEKELIGIPWRVAFALQEQGWWLRADNVWAKVNPMPESCLDRPARAHEYVFLLSKSKRYWFDMEAVKEPVAADQNGTDPLLRHLRTVWQIPVGRFNGAHFAVFPLELPTRCIRAGAAREVCQECGKPRVRIVERGEPVLGATTWSANGARQFDVDAGDYEVVTRASSTLKHIVPNRTLGWTDCGHDAYRRGRVLDPFLGAGTTAVAALREGRDAIGIELSQTYADTIIAPRLARWWEDTVATEPDAADPDQLALID